jgi:diadenosine tetraphosphate (Ap4A) HIT family hydrolase
MTSDCEICRRIERITDDNPYLIAELESGYAVLGDNQYIPGYCILLSKTCVPELHELPRETRTLFLEEMALLAEAVWRAFSPRKLNYELLGNSVAHLHWHIFPRYEDDANLRWPVWSNPAFIDAAEGPRPSRERLAELRAPVARELAALRRERGG